VTGLFRPGPAVRLFAAGLLVAGLMAVQVTGQPKDKAAPKDKTKAPAAPAKLDPKTLKTTTTLNTKEVVRHVKKAAKKFEPFKMRDPSKAKTAAGSIVPGTTMLDVEVAGKKVKMAAKKYYDALNGVEKLVTAAGYSHRDPIKPGVATVLTKSEQKTAEQETRVKKLKSTLVKFDKTKHKVDQAKVKRADHAKQFKTAVSNKAAEKKRVEGAQKHLNTKYGKPGSKVKPRAVFTPQGTTKNWSWMLGRKNILAGELRTKLETKGDANGLSIVGSADAVGWLVNQQVNILGANGTIRVPRTGNSNANLSVTVFGARVYTFDKSVNTTFEKSDTFQKTLEKSATFRASIGPIPVAAKVGIQGTVGLRYMIGLRPLYCNAQVVPFLKVKAYAQAGVDIFIAGAGAGGQLTLIDAELRVGGKLALRFESTRTYLEENAYIYGQVNMLAGSLYLYLEVTVPRWGLPPWHKKRWTWDIWKWNGIKYGGYLVNVTKTHNL